MNELVVASASTSKDARIVAIETIYSTLETAQNDLSSQDMVRVSYSTLDFN